MRRPRTGGHPHGAVHAAHLRPGAGRSVAGGARGRHAALVGLHAGAHGRRRAGRGRGAPGPGRRAHPARARRVTDGPFAATAEILGGFYVIDVPDWAAAEEWAAKIPSAPYGSVEIRP